MVPISQLFFAHFIAIVSVLTRIPARSCQKFSKRIGLWDLAQGIGILSMIQIVRAI